MKYLGVVLGSIVVSFFILTLGAYLDRPTVEVDVRTQACVRAYGPNGDIPCADAVGVSHEKIFVDSNARQVKI